MKRILIVLFLGFCVVSSYAQQLPSAEVVLGDTSSSLFINDFFVDGDGTLFSTGQLYKNNVSALYCAAISPQHRLKFEIVRARAFEEKGLLVRPYDSLHFLVCGFSEDSTGTFNVRLLKMTKSGAVVWDTTFGNDGTGTMEMPEDLAVDSQGNIVVGGISQSSVINYLLLKFSSAGKLLWSKQTKPFEKGQFSVHDVILDVHDNIYGVTNNTFVDDTSHGTVYKWDADGNLLWHRNFNISFYEDRPDNLTLIGDTLLVVAGMPWMAGANSLSITMVVLRADGSLHAYSSIHQLSAQQGVRGVRRVFGNSIALINESFSGTTYYFHTTILAPDGAVLLKTSSQESTPISGAIIAVTDSSFTAAQFGSSLKTETFTNKTHSISLASASYSNGGNFIGQIRYGAAQLCALSRIQGVTSDRARFLFYTASPSSAAYHPALSPIMAPTVFPAYPNPFNPTTTVLFRLPSTMFVTLTIYDMLGRKIQTLLDGEYERGTHRASWDASGLAGGIYFYRFSTSLYSDTKRLLLLK